MFTLIAKALAGSKIMVIANALTSFQRIIAPNDAKSLKKPA